MLKEESELVIVRKLNPGEFDKIKRVWRTFCSISMEQVEAMYFAPDTETRAIFDEGYDLVRELDILHHASAQMRKAGLENGRDDLFNYCVAKEDAYAKKVHAANLDKRIPNAEGVEEQK